MKLVGTHKCYAIKRHDGSYWTGDPDRKWSGDQNEARVYWDKRPEAVERMNNLRFQASLPYTCGLSLRLVFWRVLSEAQALALEVLEESLSSDG